MNLKVNLWVPKDESKMNLSNLKIFELKIKWLNIITIVLSWQNLAFWIIIKGTLSSLRQFLATESPLKMTKKPFYFTLKDLFKLKIFKFLSWLFGHV